MSFCSGPAIPERNRRRTASVVAHEAGFISEEKLEPELDIPRLVHLRGDRASGRQTNRRRRRGKLHSIEDVERLRPELKLHLFHDGDIPEK